MTTDLTKHAEAILRAAKMSHASARVWSLDNEVLTACAALFDAGAETMREKAAKTATCGDFQTRELEQIIANDIRALDPASLRGA